MQRGISIFTVALLAVLAGSGGRCVASEAPLGYVIRVIEENDKFAFDGEDKHYSQGINVSLLWPDHAVPWVLTPLSKIPAWGITDRTTQLGVGIGQCMFTPEDIESTAVIKDDRPYAGWLYLGLMRQTRGTWFAGLPARDDFELDLGVVGPSSLAGNTQTWYHDLINVPEANGWDNQINDEFAFAIMDERSVVLWEHGRNDELRTQFVPHFGGCLGNYQTFCDFGAEMRFGHNFFDGFSKSYEPTWGWCVFIGSTGRVVLWDTTLDGNTFKSSQSVDKVPFVADLRVGFLLELKRVEFSFTYVYRTPEFRDQDVNDAFGSLNVSYRF